MDVRASCEAPEGPASTSRCYIIAAESVCNVIVKGDTESAPPVTRYSAIYKRQRAARSPLNIYIFIICIPRASFRIRHIRIGESKTERESEIRNPRVRRNWRCP